MNEAITTWILEHLGTVGLIIIGETTAVLTLAAAVFFLFKRYVQAVEDKTVLSETHAQQERSRLEAQSECCRSHMEVVDEKHSKEMKDYYDTMRAETNAIIGRLERALDKMSSSMTNLVTKIAELSGKLDGIGRNRN